MYVYAEVDTSGRWPSNTVIQAILVKSVDGEVEAEGEVFCQAMTGSTNPWIKGSTTGSFRKHAPSIGHTWDEGRDAFIPPQPWPSWVFDEENCDWNPPASAGPEPGPPDDPNLWVWDEDNVQWIDTGLAAPTSETHEYLK